jgi:muramoyltetrapeptide carboxypeptidase
VNIKPARLQKGDEIAIIAPAGPVTVDEIQPAVDILVQEGYRVKKASHLFARQGYLAGNDEARLADLHSVFNNDNIKALLCARGGYGTLRFLDKIDYDRIKKNPKIILGYSDITALLMAIHKMTGLVTFHGPVVRDLSGIGGRGIKDFFDTVSSQRKLKFDLSGGTVLAEGKAKGPLLGGNLSLLSHLIGTPFIPPMKGVILFMEEKGESLYRIDRMLTHLRLGGILKDLSGMIIGDFIDCGDMEDIHGLLTDIMAGIDIPVFSGLPVGHGDKNMTIPVGLQAELDTGSMKLKFLETCVAT